MRHVTIGLLLSFLLSTSLAADRTPKIGSTIGELRFKDIRSVQRSLADFGKKRAYVFVFTTTQCPLVGRTLPKLMELDSRFGPQEVQFVAVNVGAEDSIRDMAAQALEFDVSFPFVKDGDLSIWPSTRRRGTRCENDLLRHFFWSWPV